MNSLRKILQEIAVTMDQDGVALAEKTKRKLALRVWS